jgi:endonuclease YncB( thermonuclease family)
VVSIVDGDTLVVSRDHEHVTVRLLGIDAPEKLQPFGDRSQAGLSALTFGREVRVEDGIRDGKGATIAKVWAAEPTCSQPECPKKVDVGLAQIAAGMAWHNRPREIEQSAADRAGYAQAEFAAKIRRLGLWSDKNPAPPWEWRSAH